MMKTEELKLTQEWDKTFPKSDKVDHKKVICLWQWIGRKMNP